MGPAVGPEVLLLEDWVVVNRSPVAGGAGHSLGPDGLHETVSGQAAEGFGVTANWVEVVGAEIFLGWFRIEGLEAGQRGELVCEAAPAAPASLGLLLEVAEARAQQRALGYRKFIGRKT